LRRLAAVTKFQGRSSWFGCGRSRPTAFLVCAPLAFGNIVTLRLREAADGGPNSPGCSQRALACQTSLVDGVPAIAKRLISLRPVLPWGCAVCCRQRPTTAETWPRPSPNSATGVSRPSSAAGAIGFHPLPRRWVVERRLAGSIGTVWQRTSRPRSRTPQSGFTSLLCKPN
jgi:hypothetical protein